MKTKLFSIVFLIMVSLGFAQDYKFFDNFVYSNKVYELHLQNDEAEKNYKIKIVKGTETPPESGLLTYDYDENQFIVTLSEMMTEIDSAFAITPELRTKWVSSYNKIMKDVNKKEVLTELYDNQPIEYSGKIRLKDTITLLYTGKNDFKKKLKHTSVQTVEKKSNEGTSEAESTQKDSASAKEHQSPKTLDFISDYASIRFYNNRINSISVVGKVNGKEITIRNNKFSVPFRFLNNNQKGSYLNVFIDDNTYELNFDDLLDYNPVGTEFNFSVKNKNYEIKAKEEVKIESRNLFDYFTAIVFSDFLGVSNTGSNSLLMAEGRAVIPLALVNRNQSNLINYFEGYLTTSLYNGQEDGTNFVTWKSDLANGGVKDKVVLFDFFKKRNIETGLNFGIYTFEWKGISTNVILDYGVQFYRSKLRYIKDDQNTFEDYQLYCIGHGPKVKFEIRPQVNFGADLNIGFLGFNFNGMSGSNDLRKELKSVMEDKATFLNGFYIVSNFYTKLNDKESNSGLYFRLGSFYDFDTSDIAPQVMVGYATNLTSFINKFKKKDEVPTTSATQGKK